MHNQTQIHSLRPAQALTGMAQQYVYELANELRVDPDMIACAMLSTVTAAGMGSIDCAVTPNFPVPGVLWMLVGAPSGAGKTPVFSRVQGVLEQVISEKMIFSREKMREVESLQNVLTQRIKRLDREAAKCTSEERSAILNEIVACRRELDELKIPVSPIIDLISIYAFIKEMSARNGVMAALGAEGSILACFNKVSTNLLQPVLKSWNLETISNISKKDGEIFVASPKLHIAAAWQPDEARKILLDDKFSSIGLTARFLYYEIPLHTRFDGNGKYLSSEADCWWGNVISRQVDYHVQSADNCVPRLNLSREAQEVLESHRLCWTSASNTSADFEKLLCKSSSHAVRISIALHCLEEDIFRAKTISSSTMMRACELTEFFLREYFRVMSREKDKKIRRLAFKLCQIFSTNQVSLANPVVSLPTSFLAMQVEATQKSVNQAMYWLARRVLVCEVPILLNNLKTVQGWEIRQSLGCYQNEDMLP